MEAINFWELMDNLKIKRCEVADYVGVTDQCLWKWCRRANNGKLDPAKVALIRAAIQNISEQKK